LYRIFLPLKFFMPVFFAYKKCHALLWTIHICTVLCQNLNFYLIYFCLVPLPGPPTEDFMLKTAPNDWFHYLDRSCWLVWLYVYVLCVMGPELFGLMWMPGWFLPLLVALLGLDTSGLFFNIDIWRMCLHVFLLLTLLTLSP
jgi:hypothetical protein